MEKIGNCLPKLEVMYSVLTQAYWKIRGGGILQAIRYVKNDECSSILNGNEPEGRSVKTTPFQSARAMAPECYDI